MDVLSEPDRLEERFAPETVEHLRAVVDELELTGPIEPVMHTSTRTRDRLYTLRFEAVRLNDGSWGWDWTECTGHRLP